MKCERCQKAEATVHLTQVIDGQIKKLNLCEACAKAGGFDVGTALSLTDVLLGLGLAAGEKQTAQARDTRFSPDLDLVCAGCRLSRSEFKRRGRFGCPECYRTFIGELGSLTKAMHHSSQHVGKVPMSRGKQARIAARIAVLRKEIEQAVAREEFETAARLRDEIKELQAGVKTAGEEA